MFLWKNSHQSNLEKDDSLSLSQQEAKVKEVREALGPLFGRSAKFCTDGCLRRYLKANKWNVSKAAKMLEDTLNWRATYKPEEIRWHEVAREAETGKFWRANFRDRQGRTVLVLRAGKHKTKGIEGNVRHFVYTLENGIFNLPEGQDQISMLIDFTSFSINNNTSVKLARELINIVQNHYPDIINIGILYDPPKIFEALWRAIKYFLNSSTYRTVKFVYPKNKESAELMRSYFDANNLPKEFGGNVTLDYNHEEYSKLMVEDDKKAAEFWGF